MTIWLHGTLLVLSWCGAVCGQSGSLAKGEVPNRPKGFTSPLARPVASFTAKGEPALGAILRFGRQNKVPLGIVVSEPLCAGTVKEVEIRRGTVQDALNKLTTALPSYRWTLEDGAVVLAPAQIPRPVERFLALVPPDFSIQEGPLNVQAGWAWLHFQAAIRKPKGAIAGSILGGMRMWPALTVRGLTVRQTLNRLVARGKGAAWVLLPFSDFERVAERCPYSLIDYAEHLMPGSEAAPACVDKPGR